MTKQELIQFICEIFNIEQCPEMVLKQIHKYVTERRYDYLEIARALSYFVDVEGNEPQIKYGIGIVPIVMEDSRKYFKKLKEQKEAQLRAARESKRKENKRNVIYVKINDKKTIHRPHIDIDKL